MNFLRTCLLAACLLACAAPARAFVPQTIVIDGVNDFDSANLLDDDRGDTEIKNWCVSDAENDSTMDIGRVFITNDANFLYLGFEYFEDCFTDPFVQLGIAIDVNNTAAGGTSDPFTRKVGWSNLPSKPDAYIYLEQTAFNYEIFYRWTGTAWADSTTLINPAGSGGNALGASDHARFVELRIPLSALRTAVGQTLNVELWMTQNSPGKGPLDAARSDNVQMSRATQTTFDTTDVVQMTGMFPYTVLSAVDAIPPTVGSACAVGFPLLADKRFVTSTNKVDVLFDEPVDLTTAQTTGNYAFSGPVSRNVVSAIRDGTNAALVHLTLNSVISANAAFYDITVSGVKDAAGNTIVANGTTNVGSFFMQNLAFEGDFRLRLCKMEFAPDDIFAVEGSLSPLTFTVGDNARMFDANADSIYTTTVPFCMPKSRSTGKAEADLEWKFSHTPSEEPFEPGSNRIHRLSSDGGATTTLAASWANDSIGDFTEKPIEVVFQVDARRVLRLQTQNSFWLTGSQAPLSFDLPPTMLMKDDGVPPDVAAGDSVYTLRVRFPVCSSKDMEWKVVYDSSGVDTVFECLGQGNRDLFLNTAAFDTVGGENGPLTLPARGIDRCNVTDKPVAVVFRVSMLTAPPASGDTVAVMGNRPPLNLDRPPSVPSILADDGIAPDEVSADLVYTGKITFPDSTGTNVQFKYWLNSFTNFGFECEGSGDRSFNLDDVNYSATVPFVRNLDLFNDCREVVGVPFVPRPADAVAQFAVLKQSFPNPFSPRTTIRFELRRAGRASLTIYDVSGRRVATLVDRDLGVGPHEVVWNGRGSGGARVEPGVYLYELALGGQRLSRRLVVTQ